MPRLEGRALRFRQQQRVESRWLNREGKGDVFGTGFESSTERQRVSSYKELVKRILGGGSVYEMWNDITPRKLNITKRMASALSAFIPEPTKRDLEYFATLTPESMFELLAEQITFLQNQEHPLHYHTQQGRLS